MKKEELRRLIESVSHGKISSNVFREPIYPGNYYDAIDKEKLIELLFSSGNFTEK